MGNKQHKSFLFAEAQYGIGAISELVLCFFFVHTRIVLKKLHCRPVV